MTRTAMPLALPPAVVRALRHPEPADTDFTATKFSPASSKTWFVTHFLRFVSADFPKHHFAGRFYTRLSGTFGHIAHYDSAGFFEEFFTSADGKVEFLEQTLAAPCYGNPDITWSDAELFIIRRLRETRVLDVYRARVQADERARDHAELARIIARYGGDQLDQGALRTVLNALATRMPEIRTTRVANDQQQTQTALAFG